VRTAVAVGTGVSLGTGVAVGCKRATAVSNAWVSAALISGVGGGAGWHAHNSIASRLTEVKSEKQKVRGRNLFIIVFYHANKASLVETRLLTIPYYSLLSPLI